VYPLSLFTAGFRSSLGSLSSLQAQIHNCFLNKTNFTVETDYGRRIEPNVTNIEAFIDTMTGSDDVSSVHSYPQPPLRAGSLRVDLLRV
jgi:hypothetical protein